MSEDPFDEVMKRQVRRETSATTGAWVVDPETQVEVWVPNNQRPADAVRAARYAANQSSQSSTAPKNYERSWPLGCLAILVIAGLIIWFIVSAVVGTSDPKDAARSECYQNWNSKLGPDAYIDTYDAGSIDAGDRTIYTATGTVGELEYGLTCTIIQDSESRWAVEIWAVNPHF
jgi:hypothetical protein